MSRRRTISPLPFVALLAAAAGVRCSGAPLTSAQRNADAADERAPDGNEPNDCAPLAVSECAKVSHCQVLTARPVAERELCALPSQEVGCAALGCGGTLTRAKDPSGTEWLFPGTCVPPGWTAMPTDPELRFQSCPPCDPASTEKACAATSFCEALYAEPIDPQQCLVPAKKFVGCLARDVACVGPETHAQDPSGQEWLLGSCLPAGWTATSKPTNLPVCQDCATLRLTACATASSCRVLSGQPVDEQRACLDAPLPVACVRADLTCDDSITLATAPNGTTWSFSSSCIPAGWTDATGNDASRPPCPAGDGGADGP
jgi:hypothetical protein